MSVKGSSASRPGQALAVDVEGDPRLVLHTLTPEREPEVQQEELVEGQPPVGRAPVLVERAQVVVRRGLVDARERLRETGEREPLAQLVGQRILHLPQVRRGDPRDSSRTWRCSWRSKPG